MNLYYSEFTRSWYARRNADDPWREFGGSELALSLARRWAAR